MSAYAGSAPIFKKGDGTDKTERILVDELGSAIAMPKFPDRKCAFQWQYKNESKMENQTEGDPLEKTRANYAPCMT